MNFDYKKTCQTLLADLPERTKKVIVRRFGLEGPERETLQTIGESHGITRERVRQIERDGILRMKPKVKNLQSISQYFSDQLKRSGNLRKEDILFSLWGGEKLQNHIYFLLTLSDQFDRFPENQELYSLWTIDRKSLKLAQKIINTCYKNLNKIGRPLALENCHPGQKRLNSQALLSYLEVSKKIQSNSEGFFGLKDWPEINPRGIKDKAYLVFKKEEKPLHFTQVAKLIDTLPFPKSKAKNKERAKGTGTLPQTVHNELIRDARFVLVGRGTYALKEWGFAPGTVLDIIIKVIKEAKKPLSKQEILNKVLKQRMVKENTVLLNLSNKEYFLKSLQGKYQIKES